MSKFVFFDVETPNRNNDRISSIGLIVVESGKVIYEACHLVNPETQFDRFNIQLTGITPNRVKDAPNFKKLWDEIGLFFDGAILVAHNATFDLSVLTMLFTHYGLEVPRFNYICTLDLSRRFLRYRKNSLDFVCATLGILLEQHHEALSDAKACRDIFYYIVEHFGYDDTFTNTFYKPFLRGRSHAIKPSSQPTLKSTTKICEIKDQVFCLTGDFEFGDKYDVELFILAHGGTVSAQMSKKVNYLLVGAYGSHRWAYGNYGKKVERAYAYRTAGQPVEILLEKDFFQCYKG